MPQWRPRLKPHQVAPLTTTVRRVVEHWVDLHKGGRKRRFTITLDEPFKTLPVEGQVFVMRDEVETWDAWQASLCDQAAHQGFRVRLQARDTGWGLQLLDGSRGVSRT